MLSQESMISFVWGSLVFSSLPMFMRFLPVHQRNGKKGPRRDHLSLPAWFVYASFFCALVFTASITFRQSLEIQFRNSKDPNIVEGLGMPFKDALNSMMVSLGEMQAFVLCLWTVKWSFLFMYMPMLPRLSKALRILWWCILGWTIIGFGIVFPLEFIWCRPANRLWSFEDDYCSSWRSTSGLLVGVMFNVTADLLVICFPILILRSIARTSRERAGVFFLVFIGVFVMASSFIRLIILINRNKRPENATTGSLQMAEIWAGVEAYAALFAVNLPAAKAFIMGKFFGRDPGSQGVETVGSMAITRRKMSVPGSQLVGETESETKIYGVGANEVDEHEFDLVAVEFGGKGKRRDHDEIGPGFQRIATP